MGYVVIHQSVAAELEALCSLNDLDVQIIEDTYPLNHAWVRRVVVVADDRAVKIEMETAQELPAAVVDFLLHH